VKIPDYPKLLTAADWQKNKGNVAKLKGETGLGDALKEAEAAYVTFEKGHHDNQIASCNNDSQVTKVGSVADDVLRRFEKAMDSAAQLATTVAKAYKESKVVGKTTREHVEEIAEAAKNDSKFRKAMNAAHMEFVEGCMVYYRQPSVIGGSVLKNFKEAVVALPKFAKMLELIEKLGEQERTDPENKFCSALSKFAGETARSMGQNLIDYAQKAKDSEITKLVPLWGEPGKMRPANLKAARTFLDALGQALKQSAPILKKKGFKI
jgi:hypothetical protein